MSNWTVPGYSEVRELGTGATGRVVEALHDASGQHVAIKYLTGALFNDEAFLTRFRDEARLLVDLDAPHVVRLFEYVEEPGLGAAIVMELVDGASLHQLISHRGPTTPESALAVLKGSLLGLAAAHAVGVVHRDYKPENVLVDSSGDSKLADFGIAVQAGRRVGAVGTPLYMAPEQWTGGEASPATDIYAATAVFYECLTGKPPFSGRLSQLRREHEGSPIPAEAVPPPLRDLVRRGMAKDPAGRPTDARAFVVELQQIAVAAYGADWEQRGRRQLAERTAALLLLLLGGGVVGAASGAAAATFLARRRVQIIAATATVAVLGATAVGVAAVTSSNNNHSHGHTNLPSHGKTHGTPPSAAASVAPAALTRSCAGGPAKFMFTGSITARQAGSVTYQWIFSTGQTSTPVTLQFSSPGAQPAASQLLTASSSVHGWAKLRVTSPAAAVSNEAVYQLTCTHPGPSKKPPVVTPVTATVSAAAQVAPVSSTITCGAARPAFIFSGAITTNTAGTVTYHWALSNGTATAARSLTFSGAGTASVVSDMFTPPADTFTGSARIVVTSPVGVTSNAAAFTLSCAHAKLAVTLMSSPPSPASFVCGTPPPGFTVTGAIKANRATAVTYHWVRSDGTSTGSATISIGTGQTRDVTDSWTPLGADNFTGTDTLRITAPVSQSTSIPISEACTGSHVLTVTIVQGMPVIAGDGNSGTLTYTVTITTDGTGPVTFDWGTSLTTVAEGYGPYTGPPQTLSGSTSYVVQLPLVGGPSLGFPDGSDCNAPPPLDYFVLSVTATGTDGQTVPATSSYLLACGG